MFTKDVRKLTDDEVGDQRSNLSKQIDKIKSATKLINELLESTNPVTETKVDDNSKISFSSVDKEAKPTKFAQLALCKIPHFYLISWCGTFVERHSFCLVSYGWHPGK